MPTGAAGALPSSRTSAEPPSRLAFSKAVGRTVSTLTASDEATVARALPAYIGRTKVFSSLISSTSDNCDTSSSAATRGSTLLLNADAPATTCVWPPSACAAKITGVHSSARPLVSAADSTYDTDETPATVAAASATALLPSPPTSMWTGPSDAEAATAASVPSETAAPSCSPTTSVDRARPLPPVADATRPISG